MSARRRYEYFSGRRATTTRRVEFEVPRSAAAVGEVTGILYRAERDGETREYLHKFASGSRPTLAVSPDGEQLLLIGGRYKFGARGIVDKPPKGQ